MAVVTPLEDLLQDKDLSLRTYNKLKRELARYVSYTDAKHLAWHITIPQHIFLSSANRRPSILPQYDTLACAHCKTSFRIPMVYPRIHEVTAKAFRSVHYKPSPPQECPCGNLKTLTDAQGNLRVYLIDPKEDSWTLHYGPIDLRGAQSIPKDSAYDIDKLFDAPRPSAEEPFSFEVRSSLLVNHINLYRASPMVMQMLLPYEDYRLYARAYNLVIFGGRYVYFPTGHKIPTTSFSSFTAPLTSLGLPIEESASKLLDAVVLTKEIAKKLNMFAEYLYFEELPLVIERNYQRFTNKLAKKLNITPTGTSQPLFLPYMQRLEHEITRHGVYAHKDNPERLSFYIEMTSLRLPQFAPKERTPNFNKQDFRFKWYRFAHPRLVHYALNRKDTLLKLKRDRVKLLRYMLPRLTATPKLILEYAQRSITHTTIPPTIPINHLLLRATSLPPRRTP